MKMKRNVIEINEEKCVGCGLCAGACMQGAIQIIDGKAKLTSDSYCDGLGMCLPKCPVDAIHLVEKETDAFDQTRKNIKNKDAAADSGCGCPGSQAKTFTRNSVALELTPTKEREKKEAIPVELSVPSELMQWPVQLKLVSPNAPFFNNADLLVAADCTAFAYGDFHREFIKGKVAVIGCPKLDDNQYNIDKLTEILKNNTIKSITVVRMEVPCCGGMPHAVREAMLNARCIVPYNEVTITSDGRIKA
jgi:Fe-S-cluster-containing hydrogenase component 2